MNAHWYHLMLDHNFRAIHLMRLHDDMVKIVNEIKKKYRGEQKTENTEDYLIGKQESRDEDEHKRCTYHRPEQNRSQMTLALLYLPFYDTRTS